jgi:hypothetical protein
MTFLRFARSVCFILLLMSPALTLPGQVWATPILIVQSGDATVSSSDSTGTLPLYLLTVSDSVAAFELKITASDSLAVEFLESLDTTGTLISGWQFQLVAAFPGGIHMIWLPNQIGQNNIPSIAPSPQIRQLVKLPFKLHGLDPAASYTFEISIDTTLDDFGFSDPFGYLIGVRTDTLVDSQCFRCVDWQGTICQAWEMVLVPPCDSLGLDSFPSTHLDTSKTWVFGGSINAVACCQGTRGNVNGDTSDLVDLSDLSQLVAYLVSGGNTPSCTAEADLNGSGLIDITDLSMLISYLLTSGTLLNCG